MKFCLIINSNKHWHDTIPHALQLARAMTRSGHSLNAVFFYGQAVNVIQSHATFHPWQQYQTETHCQLMLCSTMLESLDIHPEASIDGFSVVGLASLTQAMEMADRTVELT